MKPRRFALRAGLLAAFSAGLLLAPAGCLLRRPVVVPEIEAPPGPPPAPEFAEARIRPGRSGADETAAAVRTASGALADSFYEVVSLKPGPLTVLEASFPRTSRAADLSPDIRDFALRLPEWRRQDLERPYGLIEERATVEVSRQSGFVLLRVRVLRREKLPRDDARPLPEPAPEEGRGPAAAVRLAPAGDRWSEWHLNAPQARFLLDLMRERLNQPGAWPPAETGTE